MDIETKALDIAQETARQAGEKILPFFGRTLVIKEKGSPTDISSEADLLAEKIIFSKLSPNFKNFNYLSEEQEFLDKGSEYTWVVDPLDGSIPFVAGLEYWGISIGLLKKNQPVVGVIYIPGKDWLFWAAKNQGAFLNNQRISVSKNKSYDKAIVGFDLGHGGFRHEDLGKSVVPQVEKVRYMPSYGCATFGQVLVAKGVYDAYLHHRAFSWDFCAGTIIIQEAGGKVTDHNGKPIDWTKIDNLFMLASNSLLHPQILEALG